MSRAGEPASAPRIALRFDCDTFVCVSTGLDNLLDLTAKYGVPMTLFVNVGRAFSARQALRERKRRASSTQTNELSPLRKLGIPASARLLLANPSNHRVGHRRIREAAGCGHEIGLHGGRNHALWVRSANKWSSARLAREIGWGLSRLRQVGVRPDGFSSPGWVGQNPALSPLLRSMGFSYIADDFELGEQWRTTHDHGLVRVPTNLGGPSGEAFFEAGIAAGMTPDTIVESFAAGLRPNSTHVVYDHPYFAGREGLGLLERCIATAIDLHGAQFMTMRELMRTSGS